MYIDLNLFKPNSQNHEPCPEHMFREVNWTELDLNLELSLTVWSLNPGSGPNFGITRDPPAKPKRPSKPKPVMDDELDDYDDDKSDGVSK